MTQSEVTQQEKGGYSLSVVSGHFRLGRLVYRYSVVNSRIVGRWEPDSQHRALQELFQQIDSKEVHMASAFTPLSIDQRDAGYADPYSDRADQDLFLREPYPEPVDVCDFATRRSLRCLRSWIRSLANFREVHFFPRKIEVEL